MKPVSILSLLVLCWAGLAGASDHNDNFAWPMRFSRMAVIAISSPTSTPLCSRAKLEEVVFKNKEGVAATISK